MALIWTDPVINVLPGGTTPIKRAHITDIRTYLDNHINVVPSGVLGSYTGEDTTHKMASATNNGFMSKVHFAVCETLVNDGNGVLTVTGSASSGISVNLSSPNAPAISLLAANNTSQNGYLKWEDKKKLDDAGNIAGRLNTIETVKGEGSVKSISVQHPLVITPDQTVTPTLSIDLSGYGFMSSQEKNKLAALDPGFPVGTVIMWYGTGYAAGDTSEGNPFKAGGDLQKWVICDGRTYMDALNQPHVSPDFSGRVPFGATTGSNPNNEPTKFNNMEGSLSTKLEFNHIPEHRHVTGEFSTTSNNDFFPITAGPGGPGGFRDFATPSLTNLPDKYSSLSGDGTGGHGFWDGDALKSPSQYVAWTSRQIFRRTTETNNATPIVTMPPIRSIYFLLKYK